MCHQSYICHLLFWSKKIQMESKLACIKVSGIFIDRINNDDSIWKHFNFYLQMLTNFKLSEFRQRTVWVVLISFPLLLQIFSAFFWRTQYWKLSDAKYWTICKIVYTRMADPMILEAFSNLQFSYFFFFPKPQSHCQGEEITLCDLADQICQKSWKMTGPIVSDERKGKRRKIIYPDYLANTYW